MLFRRLLPLFVILLSGAAWARPSLSVTANPTTATMGSNVRVRIEIAAGANEDAELITPDLTNWRLVGRVQSSGYDSRSNQSTTTLQLVLQPTAVGDLRVPAFQLKTSAGVIRSQAITIKVGGSGPPPLDPAAPPAAGQDAPPDLEFFLAWEADKTEAWLGEEVQVTLYAYASQRTRISNFRLGQIELNGFWKEEMDTNRRRGQHVTIGGYPFNKQIVTRMRLFPIRAGTLNLPPVEATFRARRRQQSRRAEPIPIVSKTLPQAGRPASYRGMTVGKVKLRANLNRSTINADEGVQLTIATEVEGRIAAVPKLKIESLPGFKVFPPTEAENTFERGGTLRGRRQQTWLLRPKAGGRSQIPSQTIGYFDPKTGRYAEARTRPLSVTVRGKVQLAPSDAARPTADAKDRPALRTIRKGASIEAASPPARRTLWVILFLIIAPLSFVGLLVRERVLQRRDETSDQRAARGAFALARSELLALPSDAQHSEISRILLDYLQARTGEAVRGLTRPLLAQMLHARGVKESESRALIAELENADFARFAPSGSGGAHIKEAVERSADLLKRLEEALA